MPHGTVAVRVVLSTKVTLVSGVESRVTVGALSTLVPSMTAVKSDPVMVTGVSTSLGPEEGEIVLTVGVTASVGAAQTGPTMIGVVWALAAALGARTRRATKASKNGSFFTARPPTSRCASSPQRRG